MNIVEQADVIAEGTLRGAFVVMIPVVLAVVLTKVTILTVTKLGRVRA